MTELAPLAMLPAVLLRNKVLKPMRYMAGGTMLVSKSGWTATEARTL